MKIKKRGGQENNSEKQTRDVEWNSERPNSPIRLHNNEVWGKSSVQEWTTVYMMCLSGHSSLQQCVSMCVCVYVFACVSGSFFISVGWLGHIASLDQPASLLSLHRHIHTCAGVGWANR